MPSVLIAIVSVAPLLSAQDASPGKYVSPWKTPWAYEGARGAAHWSELDPAYAACNAGKAQSPIDIRSAVKADLPPPRFVSHGAPLRFVINNGATIRVDYGSGNGNTLFVGTHAYELTQFHFHRPSEESIAGRRFPMETHLMFRGADGSAAGVAAFIVVGARSPVVAALWERMPRAEGQNAAPDVAIDPGELLPRDTRGYFTYEGSVTAPPCTEGVTWFVLATPIELSEGQIAAFAKLYPNDARPVQPLNGRIVKASGH